MSYIKTPFTLQGRRASALVITLVIITLITVLVVTLLVTARFERTSSSLALARAQAETFADLAADTALSRIREGIEAGTPNYTPGTGYNAKTWASMPGRIAVFDLTKPRPNNVTYYDLFSGSPGADDATIADLNNVDLNKPSIIGEYPIASPASGKTAANMKVGWINLLADQGQPAAKSNPIVGRIAFWVDDDTCKVNINTADGSKKAQMLPDGTIVSTGTSGFVESFGFGTPSEISLAPLLTGTFVTSGTTTVITSGSAQTIAAAIAHYATNSDTPWTSPGTLQTLVTPPSARMGFNSAAEIGRAPGVPAGFYQQNAFNITPTCRTPELNMFGEPRIMLLSTGLHNPVSTYAFDYLRYMGVGPYNTPYTDPTMSSAFRVNCIYPITPQSSSGTTPSQLPLMKMPSGPSVPLPQYWVLTNAGASGSPFRWRISNYLTGTNSQAQAITWPQFEGATSTTGFLGKYSLRQIDSIVANITDTECSGVYTPNDPFYHAPYNTPHVSGMLSGKPIPGLVRGPKPTELFITASTILVSGTVNLTFTTRQEYYFPKYYSGAPWHSIDSNSTINGRLIQWTVGTLSAGTSYFNAPTMSGITGSSNHDDMLTVFTGTSGNTKINSNLSIFQKTNPLWQASPYGSWNPGVYHAITGGGTITISTPDTNYRIRGGLSWQMVNTTSNGSAAYFLSVPADSDADILPVNTAAVIPVAMDITVGAPPTYYDVRVADPLVNMFPGDWKGVQSFVSGSDTGATMQMTNTAPYGAGIYGRGGANPAVGGVDPAIWPFNGSVKPLDFDGDNPEYLPVNIQSGSGGDPVSVWWCPVGDSRMPKQAAFPSVGALNFIRTGVIPDDETVPISQQHGTPWRSISLAAASSPGQSTGKGNYPDWAMLDLFTVPFLPELSSTWVSNGISNPVVPPARLLTYGGATEGRININNPRIPYPFSETVSGVTQVPPERIAPLDALFYGLQTSTSYDTTIGSPTYAKPIYTTVGGSNSGDTPVATLRDAVQTYLATTATSSGSKLCFMIPGELANLPVIDAFTFKNVKSNAWSRNDLMRSVLGSMTTQSNTYSIWVVAQTIKKTPTSTANYGVYGARDTITGEVRRHYIVEREIEPGTDGVPGNTLNPGSDVTIGTEDDPIDANYHPAMTYPLPYRWRIISVEDAAK